MKSDQNDHIVEAIKSAIEKKVLPSIKFAIETKNALSSTKLDLRSGGLHPNETSPKRTFPS